MSRNMQRETVMILVAEDKEIKVILEDLGWVLETLVWLMLLTTIAITAKVVMCIS